MAESHVVKDISEGQCLGRLHIADLYWRVCPDPNMEEKNVIYRLHRFANARHMHTRLGTDVAESIDVQPFNLDMSAHTGFGVKRFEAIAAVLSSSRTEEMDISHL